MRFICDDGGRREAGFRGDTGDCVVRATAIATGKPYRQVYNEINMLSKAERVRTRTRSSARNGVRKLTYHKYLIALGLTWTPTMLVGQGCKVHLIDGELPMGRLIVSLSKHLTAVINGVIYDTYDPQRKNIVGVDQFNTKVVDRCVYGYYTVPEGVF